MTPEQRLYAECINRHIIAAIWPFKIPGDKIPSLDVQYAKIMKRKNPVIYFGIYRLEARKSMLWLESSNLDEFADMADLGTRFVNKAFDFVQKCILLRNKLLREQRANGKDKYFIQRQTKIKEL